MLSSAGLMHFVERQNAVVVEGEGGPIRAKRGAEIVRELKLNSLINALIKPLLLPYSLLRSNSILPPNSLIPSISLRFSSMEVFHRFFHMNYKD
jgi:hypothetical protein